MSRFHNKRGLRPNNKICSTIAARLDNSTRPLISPLQKRRQPLYQTSSALRFSRGIAGAIVVRRLLEAQCVQARLKSSQVVTEVGRHTSKYSASVKCADQDTQHERIKGAAILVALYPLRRVITSRVKQKAKIPIIHNARTNVWYSLYGSFGRFRRCAGSRFSRNLTSVLC